MGSMYRVACSGCEIDEEALVGTGFMAVLGFAVCRACGHAGTRTLASFDLDSEGIEGDTDADSGDLDETQSLAEQVAMACPDCGGHLELLAIEDDSGSDDVGPCPRPGCAGQLTATWTGLWD